MTSDLYAMLDAERSSLEAEEADLQAVIRSKQERLSEVQRRLGHVRALLGNENDTADASVVTFHLPQAYKIYNSGNDICDIAEDVLSERGETPMYYKELALEVVSRGGKLGGADPGATLTARLVQDPRFVRPVSKGYYALRRDYPNARNVGARRSSRRRSG